MAHGRDGKGREATWLVGAGEATSTAAAQMAGVCSVVAAINEKRD